MDVLVDWFEMRRVQMMPAISQRDLHARGDAPNQRLKQLGFAVHWRTASSARRCTRPDPRLQLAAPKQARDILGLPYLDSSQKKGHAMTSVEEKTCVFDSELIPNSIIYPV